MITRTKRLYLGMSSLWELGMGFHAACYATFLLGHGLDLFEIGLVNVAFFTTVAIMEVPTGIFADVFGRRSSFVISGVLVAIGQVVYGLGSDFWGFVAAEMVLAIGATFASGAFEAWVVDQLNHHGSAEPLDELFAKQSILGKAANVGGAFIGAWAFDVSMSLPWFLGAVAYFFLAGFAFLLMREDYFRHESRSPREHLVKFQKTLRLGLSHGRASPIVRFATVTTVALALAVQAPNMQWQPFFGRFFGGQLGMSFVWTGIGLVTMAGAAFAPRFRAFFGGKFEPSIASLLGFVGLSISVAPIVGQTLPFALGAFLLHELGRGMLSPMRSAYLNAGIPSGTERATILSLQSVWNYVGGAIGLAASGYLATKTSIGTTWLVSGLGLAVAALLLFRKNKA